MATRIYSIKDKDGTTLGLVRAGTKNGALRHVAEKHFSVEVAGQEELVWAVSNGAQIEDAGKEPETAGE